jgi:hypothetical protein
MNITDLIAQAGGLSSIARELGMSEAQAASGAAALLPAIMGGFKKQAAASGGVEGLGGMLGKLGGAALLENVVAQHPTDVAPGNDILGQIFGSKDVSRAVAQRAATQSGVDNGLLKKMLPMLAMAAAGMMAKSAAPAQPAGGGGLGGLLGGLLGGGGAAGGLGAIASMLDRDGDGNPLDDIMGMLGKK